MDIITSVFLLTLISALCIYDTFIFYRKDGFLSLRIIFVLVFYFVYIASGFSHLLINLDGVRGFFDSVYHENIFGGYFNTLASVAVGVFYIFLRAGLNYSSSQREIDYVRVSDELGLFRSNIFIFFYSIVFVMFGVFGYSVLASAIDLSTLDRVRQLPPGIAKFVFMAGWLVWGITLLFYFGISKSRSVFMDITIFVLSLSIIVGSVLWQGGRSVIVLTAFPVLFIFLKKNKKATLPVVVLSSLAMLSYISYVSGVRKEGYTNDSTSFWEVLDWEYGRFSMIAYSFDYLYRNGAEAITAIFDALMKILLSPLYLAGLGADFVGSYEGSTVSFIGSDLFADSTTIYVVPGIISELVISSFGLLIPFFAYYSGALVAYLQNYTRLYRSNDVYYVFSIFLFSIIAFNFLNSTFYAFLNYFIFIGFPIFVIFIVRCWCRIKKRFRPITVRVF